MNVLVIGAGISGLAMAHKLTEQGHSVEILEATDQAGGRGMLLNRPGTDDWADVGTQYFHSNYKYGLALIDELGLTPQLKKISGKTRFFTGEKEKSFLVKPSLPWMPPGGLWGNIKAGLFVMRLLLSHPMQVFALEPQERLDRTVALESTSSSFIKDYIVRLLVLTGAMTEPELTNVSLLQVVRLIRIILMTDSVSLKGGTASLHGALAAKANIRFNAPVSELTLEGDKVSGVRLVDGQAISADHVVVAANAPQAADIVPSSWHIEKQFLSGIKMPPTIIVSFFLNRSLEKDVWSYYMPINGNGLVRLCVDTQQKNSGATPSGKATLQAWITNPQSAALMDQTDDAIIDSARADVENYMPGFSSWIEESSVTRHAMTIPQSSVGHNQRALDFLKSADERKEVSFCGDYLSGGYLESALWTVERASNQIKNTINKETKR